VRERERERGEGANKKYFFDAFACDVDLCGITNLMAPGSS